MKKTVTTSSLILLLLLGALGCTHRPTNTDLKILLSEKLDLASKNLSITRLMVLDNQMQTDMLSDKESKSAEITGDVTLSISKDCYFEASGSRLVSGFSGVQRIGKPSVSCTSVPEARSAHEQQTYKIQPFEYTYAPNALRKSGESVVIKGVTLLVKADMAGKWYIESMDIKN